MIGEVIGKNTRSLSASVRRIAGRQCSRGDRTCYRSRNQFGKIDSFPVRNEFGIEVVLVLAYHLPK